jgi:hypothetical protein
MSSQKSYTARRSSPKVGYVISILVNIFMWFVFHNLLNWGVEFVTQEFTQVLWAIDLTIAVTILVNALFLLYDPRWFKYLGQMAINVTGLISVFTLWRVYPFDFGGLDPIVRFVLGVAFFGILVAMIAETVSLVFRRD